MKHLFFTALGAGFLLAVLTAASGWAGSADLISMGREIMSAGWSLAGALGF